MATITRAPTSDTGTAGTIGYSTGSTGYTLVSSHPNTADPLTSYVQFGTTANSAIWFGFTSFGVPAGSTVNSVTVNYYDEEPSNGANTAAARLLVGGTHYAASTHNPSTTTTSRSDTWTTNPATSAAWTVDQVNGTGANELTGFGVIGPDSNPVWRLGSIEIVVDYSPPTHATTGALSAQSATISGAALHPHTTTGALSAQAATVAGSAEASSAGEAHIYYVIGPSSGWTDPDETEIKAGQLAGGGAATAAASALTTGGTETFTFSAATGLSEGTAYRIAFVWSDGANDSNVVVTDAFTTKVTHPTSGALSAQAATVAGSAVHPHTTTGALSAQAATVAGSAVHPHTTTGALSAQAATVSGSAVHPHTTTGALSAQAATVSGTAERSTGGEFTTTGELSAQAATVAGSAAHYTLHATTGALQAQAATVAGTAVHKTPHATSGALSAGSATVAGTAARLALHTTTGALEAGAATVSGEASLNGAVPEVEVRRRRGHATPWIAARKRMALQTWWDYLTEEEPAESTQRVIKEVKAGRPIPDVKPPKGPDSISAEKLADKIIPSRLWTAQNLIVDNVDVQRVVANAIRIAQERDDEEVLMLL